VVKKRDKSSDHLETIPGVGKSIAKDLRNIGINNVRDLQNKSPEKLYGDLCIKYRTTIDLCVLYVFRCAVYYADNEIHDPELLKWWNWKDVKYGKHTK
jgi:hypothetical protein